MPTQSMNLWDNPLYAWQQQLASGANLAKNLSPQALLGLTLGTGLGSWLGYKFGNWQRARDDNVQYGTNPDVNPVAVNAAVTNALFPRGDYDLGWKPQYQFPTAQKFFTDRVTPNPSSWNDWRQNFFTQRPTTSTPPPQSTTQQTVDYPWGNPPLKTF
ncbi:MAG: hypothetical protein IKP64_07265 [Selenomonadaceae bacterium]|nr:hypothetical protein [Selenomonadaceae bacterium]MBR4383340.1 hypothetical protein [Selenomonadaceae bacterium]